MNIKNKLLYFIFLIFIHQSSFCQDSRDIYIGIYECTVYKCNQDQYGQQNCDTSSGQLNFEKAEDTTKLEVFVGNETIPIILSKENDSLYTNTESLYRGALFYSNDSVKFSIVHSSIGYDVYQGKKKANSIKDIKIKDIMISPNPFTYQIDIKCNNEYPVKIELFDLKGNKISFKAFYEQETLIIQTVELNNGVYLIKLMFNDDTIQSYKIIKK